MLFRLARASVDAKAISAGKPGRRIKNKLVGRALGKAGFWRKFGVRRAPALESEDLVDAVDEPPVVRRGRRAAR